MHPGNVVKLALLVVAMVFFSLRTDAADFPSFIDAVSGGMMQAAVISKAH